VLEPNVERVFHDDSYGYRPGRSPVDAVRVCRVPRAVFQERLDRRP
jgi:retron-type reverse transcriptase